MIHTDERFAGSVEALVTELEGATDAELVVVAAPRSGTYRDIAVTAGAALGFLALLFLLFSPWHFQPWSVPLDVLAVGLVSSWLLNRSPGTLRRLTSRTRRDRQVLAAARDAWMEEAVYGTKRHTGALVYLSALEERVEILLDPALRGRIPEAEISLLPRHARTLEQFLDLLRGLGAVMASHAPPVAGDNPDELTNAPRVRL